MQIEHLSGSVAFLVALALVFDFLNGFHDAANSIATVVSTRVLKPYQAVLWAAVWKFVWMGLGVSVAATIQKAIVSPSYVDQQLIFAALIGAIFWNLLTWYHGIPASSSHALVGGMIGAAMAKAGTAPLLWPGIIKVLEFIVLSPIIGFVMGALLMLLISWVCFRLAPRKVDRWFRRMQLVSSAAFSATHGGNDAQKTMGIIWLLLIIGGEVPANSAAPPFWVLVSCFFAISLGTVFGGWRIIKTMGQKLTQLKPVSGCAAETAGALTLAFATWLGIPVSSTHTITGSILGAGAVARPAGVRWGVAGTLVIAWIVTIPASALVAAVAYYLGSHFLPI
jgi:PiT family inorganic phosphate transporter